MVGYLGLKGSGSGMGGWNEGPTGESGCSWIDGLDLLSVQIKKTYLLQ